MVDGQCLAVGHEGNILWASHVVHHSAEYYNLSTALRQTSTGALLGWAFYLPLAVLGIPWQMLVIVGLIDLLYQYWVHTELIGRLGVLDRILETPSNHRVHHRHVASHSTSSYARAPRAAPTQRRRSIASATS